MMPFSAAPGTHSIGGFPVQAPLQGRWDLQAAHLSTQIIIIKVQASADCTVKQALPDFSLLLLLIAMTTLGTIIQPLLKKSQPNMQKFNGKSFSPLPPF